MTQNKMTTEKRMMDEKLTDQTQAAHEAVSPSPWGSRLSGLSLGKVRRLSGLALYPLLGDRDGSLEYQTLESALHTGALTICEIGSSGTVPELELKNLNDHRVLIVDGEELIGAKQNRIVNTSVLVEAKSTIKLPVSCVEAGRWRADTAAFRSEGSHYNARGRQKKVQEVSVSMAAAGRPLADQGRVWADVEAKLSRLAVGSETQALHAVTEMHGGDLEKFNRVLGKPQAREIGAVFALGRDIVGLDLFDQEATQTALLPKLIMSYALDAIEERSAAVPPPIAVVAEWLNGLQSMTGTSNAGVGLGMDIRLSGHSVSGAALVFESTILHLSAFRAEPQSGSISAGMARSSVRRRA